MISFISLFHGVCGINSRINDVNQEERQKKQKYTKVKKGHDNIPLKGLKLELKLDKTGNRKICAD